MLPKAQLQTAEQCGKQRRYPGCRSGQNRRCLNFWERLVWSEIMRKQGDRASQQDQRQRGTESGEQIQSEWNRCFRQEMERIKEGGCQRFFQFRAPEPS